MNNLTCRTLYIILFIISFSLYACGQPVALKSVVDTVNNDWDQSIPGNFATLSNAKFDSTQIIPFLNEFPELRSHELQIRKFYRIRNYAYAWFDDGELIEQAGNLSNRIMHIKNDGIYKKMPYPNILDSLISEINLTEKAKNISTELMLTAQYFSFCDMVWKGIDKDKTKSLRWYVPRKKVAYGRYLDSLLKEPSKLFAGNQPIYRQYELLKTYLLKYKKLADTDNWSRLDLSGKSPRPGDSTQMIANIKSRLFKLQDYYGDTLNIYYNEEFTIALKRFQSRHGLTIDGLLGKETNSALNISLTDRIKQIIVNMERCRWLPIRVEGDYLVVNIPEFRLHVYHSDSLLWSCPVVVGKKVHSTVVFYDEIKYVVFSPFWNVPMSIVRNEILPGMNMDDSYLSDHRMEVKGHRQGLPVIRQLPGPKNSLGQVKFIFPNSYNIYLHDTPSKSLFEESARDFSHGCIRVAEPAKLAGFLLKDWNMDKILQYMRAGKERYINLPNKIPVYIAYFTAFVNRENMINFRKDIYSRDGKLAKVLLVEEMDTFEH